MVSVHSQAARAGLFWSVFSPSLTGGHKQGAQFCPHVFEVRRNMFPNQPGNGASSQIEASSVCTALPWKQPSGGSPGLSLSPVLLSGPVLGACLFTSEKLSRIQVLQISPQWVKQKQDLTELSPSFPLWSAGEGYFPLVILCWLYLPVMTLSSLREEMWMQQHCSIPCVIKW